MTRPKRLQPVRRNSSFVAEHPEPDGLLFSVYTSGGTKSETKLRTGGRIDLTVHRNPDAGRTGERDVRKVLMGKLRAPGHVVDPDPLPARDDRGEDFVLLIDGVRVPVQVAVVPQSPQFWKEASGGSAVRSFTPAQAVDELRVAVLAKSFVSDKRGILLALDVRHLAPFAKATIVAAYLEAHPDPAKEYGWREVWLVGPCPKYCVQLSGRT
jgi:hypothetical protein